MDCRKESLSALAAHLERTAQALRALCDSGFGWQPTDLYGCTGHMMRPDGSISSDKFNPVTLVSQINYERKPL